jgi:UDP-glucuronate 4-epimerase
VPVSLIDYIHAIEQALGIESKKEYLPMQPGDVQATLADTSKLKNHVGFKPSIPISVGIKNFVDWYLNYYVKDAIFF